MKLVPRQMASAEGKTDDRRPPSARLLAAPNAATLQGKRDRAELCALSVGDIQSRRGVMHLRIYGKGGKLRYVPLHPDTAEVIDDYLEGCWPCQRRPGALFRPVKNNMHSNGRASITADGAYKMLAGYAASLKIHIAGFGPHALRATAATNALEHEVDIAKVQWVCPLIDVRAGKWRCLLLSESCD